MVYVHTVVLLECVFLCFAACFGALHNARCQGPQDQILLIILEFTAQAVAILMLFGQRWVKKFTRNFSKHRSYLFVRKTFAACIHEEHPVKMEKSKGQIIHVHPPFFKGQRTRSLIDKQGVLLCLYDPKPLIARLC